MIFSTRSPFKITFYWVTLYMDIVTTIYLKYSVNVFLHCVDHLSSFLIPTTKWTIRRVMVKSRNIPTEVCIQYSCSQHVRMDQIQSRGSWQVRLGGQTHTHWTYDKYALHLFKYSCVSTMACLLQKKNIEFVLFPGVFRSIYDRENTSINCTARTTGL